MQKKMASLSSIPLTILNVFVLKKAVRAFISQSGGTIARTPGLCVVGEELVRSETIIAVNEERMDHSQGMRHLIESCSPMRKMGLRCGMINSKNDWVINSFNGHGYGRSESNYYPWFG